MEYMAMSSELQLQPAGTKKNKITEQLKIGSLNY